MGVAMASAAELSFNWTGFISAMISNLTFGFRAVLGKKCAAAVDCHWHLSVAVSVCNLKIAGAAPCDPVHTQSDMRWCALATPPQPHIQTQSEDLHAVAHA